jgi:hypothetical protein
MVDLSGPHNGDRAVVVICQREAGDSSARVCGRIGRLEAGFIMRGMAPKLRKGSLESPNFLTRDIPNFL